MIVERSGPARRTDVGSGWVSRCLWLSFSSWGLNDDFNLGHGFDSDFDYGFDNRCLDLDSNFSDYYFSHSYFSHSYFSHSYFGSGGVSYNRCRSGCFGWCCSSGAWSCCWLADWWAWARWTQWLGHR